LFTNQGLTKIKTRAMRSGVWFRLLSRADRAVLDLTIRCVYRVRSRVLARTISEIIRRVLRTLEANFLEKAEKVGRSIADRLSKIAVKWGNKNAYMWTDNRGFIQFLGVNTLNT
jgi:hypothetical protein